MANSTIDSTSSQLLTATYNSPTNQAFTHSSSIPFPASTATSTKDRTSYLAALRTATVTLQENINRELTARMEEDNAKAAAGASTKKGAVDESKEEDNYGEEVVEED